MSCYLGNTLAIEIKSIVVKTVVNYAAKTENSPRHSKSLSEKFTGAKTNEGTGKMQHSLIVLNLLLPSDEQSSETVKP